MSKEYTFIEYYDNVMSKEWCDEVIDYYESNPELVISRQEGYRDESTPKLEKSDHLSFIFPDKFREPLMENVMKYYREYAKKYDVINTAFRHGFEEVKFQKTEPGEGYHLWHHEACGLGMQTRRVGAWTLYLNDIKDGGETEFLYQGKRISPVAGRVSFFPASYTHVHRGNPPLKDTKYILTGWMVYDIPLCFFETIERYVLDNPKYQK